MQRGEDSGSRISNQEQTIRAWRGYEGFHCGVISDSLFEFRIARVPIIVRGAARDGADAGKSTPSRPTELLLEIDICIANRAREKSRPRRSQPESSIATGLRGPNARLANKERSEASITSRELILQGHHSLAVVHDLDNTRPSHREILAPEMSGSSWKKPGACPGLVHGWGFRLRHRWRLDGRAQATSGQGVLFTINCDRGIQSVKTREQLVLRVDNESFIREAIESCEDAEKETRGGSSARGFSGVVGARPEIGLRGINQHSHTPPTTYLNPTQNLPRLTRSRPTLNPLFFFLSPSLSHLTIFIVDKLRRQFLDSATDTRNTEFDALVAGLVPLRHT